LPARYPTQRNRVTMAGPSRALLAAVIAAIAIIASAGPILSDSADAIASIDLSRIEKRVAKEHNWSAEKTAEVAKEYRRFLQLLRRHGSSARIVPSKEVDEIWHAHILYTEQYAADCERIFGFYMHHAPSDDTAEARAEDQKEYQDVLRMYRQEFGEAPGRAWSKQDGGNAGGAAGACGANCSGSCGSSCGAGKCKTNNQTMATMCPMAMYFGAQVETCIWLEKWHVTKGWQYALSCAVIILICMIREWLTAYRQKRHADRARDSKRQVLLENSGKVNNTTDIRPPTVLEILIESIYYAVNVTLAYLLMLLVMTYNVGICVAVIFGLFLGNFVFTLLYSRSANIKPAEADHCCETYE